MMQRYKRIQSSLGITPYAERQPPGPFAHFPEVRILAASRKHLMIRMGNAG